MQVIGDPPFDFGFEKLGIILSEIHAAMPSSPYSLNVRMQRDYDGKERRVFDVVVRCHGWEFTRNWYYWCAHTAVNPIPKEAAIKFNEEWGRGVRVDGFAGGKDVKEDVFSYHIDSLDGLRVFAQLLDRKAKEMDRSEQILAKIRGEQ